MGLWRDSTFTLEINKQHGTDHGKPDLWGEGNNKIMKLQKARSSAQDILLRQGICLQKDVYF